MSRLALYLLGPPRIELDSAPVHIGRSKAVALLAYLAVTGSPHSREALATLLWPESTSSRARANLRRVLVTLRQALGEEWLDVQPEIVGLLPSEHLWLDVAAFQELLAMCQTHEHAPDQACSECLPPLVGAVELYRDDFLAGFTLPDSLAFDEWQFFQAERLREGLVSVLQRLVCWHNTEGEHDAAITYARRWLELDPLHEAAHRQLMELYAEAGRRGAALRQYRACVRVLEEELGVPPSAGTTMLYDRIRAERARAAPAASLSADAPAELPAFLLEESTPTAIDRPVFVARERELGRLDEVLEKAVSGQGQVAFITGGPGRGKTALMREFIGRAVEAHTDLLVAMGACSAHAGVGDPYLPFREVLAMLSGDVEGRWATGTISREGAQRLWRVAPLTAQTVLDCGPYLVDALVSGPALLSRATAAVSGNPEWLGELQGWVQRERSGHTDLEQRAIFEQYTNVLCSLSSKHPLLLLLDDLQWADKGSFGLLFHLGRRVQSERLLIVGAYRPEEVTLQREGGPHPLRKVVAEFQRQFGDVALDLVDVDQAEGHRFVEAVLDTEPNRLDREFRDALYRRTGGHPLFTVELLRTMQEGGDLVREAGTGGAWVEGAALDWGALPARVEAVIKARVDRLDEESRDLLAVAAVEGETFTVQAVAEVQDLPEREVLRAFSRELGARHRLVREAGEVQINARYLSRYRFAHALFQSYIYDGLSPGERRLLHGEVGAALEALYGAQAEAVAVQLAYHYTEAGRPEKVATYALCAGDQARVAYANDEAVAHYQQVLALLDAPALQESRDELRLAALRGLGQVHLGTSNIAEAEACFCEAINIGKEMGLAPHELVRLHWWLADANFWQGKTDGIKEIAEDGLALLGIDPTEFTTTALEEAFDSTEAVLMYTHLAIFHFYGSRRNMKQYLEVADRLAQFSENLPYSPKLRSTYTVLWESRILQKNAKEALEWIHLLEERANRHHDLRALGAAYQVSAYTLAQSGDLSGALLLFKQGLEHYKRVGDSKHESQVRCAIGDLVLGLGDPPQALEYMLAGLEIVKASGFKAPFVISSYSGAGLTALCLGAWKQAEDAFQNAVQISQELGRYDDVVWNDQGFGAGVPGQRRRRRGAKAV